MGCAGDFYSLTICYAELYLGVSSSSLRTTRQCTSVVLVPRVEGEGFSVSMCD
jgi:hypothetical protein